MGVKWYTACMGHGERRRQPSKAHAVTQMHACADKERQNACHSALCRMLRWRPAGGAVAAPSDDDVLSRLLEAFDVKLQQGSKQTREKRFEANIHLMKQQVLVGAGKLSCIQ